MSDRLVPAVMELRIVGAATLVLGAARLAGVLPDGGPAGVRAAAAGFGACVALLWLFWGARTVRTAIRLALPARARWSPEGAAATALRALVVHVMPVTALAILVAPLAEDRVAGASAAAAGALAGAGVSALLAARQVRRAEAGLQRRLLREHRLGAPLGRRSLYLEPQVLSERVPGGPATPWPAHRPPPRPQISVIEMDPVNPSARHAVGVRGLSARARVETAATGAPPPRRGDPRA